MPWVLRVADDNLKFCPAEAPAYTNADLFTIKMFYGGEFEISTGVYVGGSFRYADQCDVDEMSILEIGTMFEEAFGSMGYCEFSYKLPKSNALFPLPGDTDVVQMCEKLDASRVIYVYGVTVNFVEEELQDLGPYDKSYEQYLSDPKLKQYEDDQMRQLLELEDMVHYLSDNGGNVEDGHEDAGHEVAEPVLVTDVDLDNDNVSFHEDSSNVDSADEEVNALRDLRNKLKENRVAQNNVDSNAGKPFSYTEFMHEAMLAVPTGEAIESDISDVEYNSEEERMAANSTDDDTPSFPVFNEQTDMANPKFEIGLMFTSARSFRTAVKQHAIINRKEVLPCKNFGKKIKYVCQGQGCAWKIYASLMQDSQTYQVKTLVGVHKCPPTFKQKLVTYGWLAEHYENEIRMNPTWPLAAFHKKIVNDLGCEVSIYTAGRAKRKALEVIKGNHVAQYAILYDYVYALKKAMPQTTIDLVLDEPEAGVDGRRFKRIYVCLGPVKRGFTMGCRPLIGLDGCHLKGPFGGQLLTAVGCDANDGMYPIAWAVVEAENSETWNWFLTLLASDVNIINSGSWTFISDRQKGLINALVNVVPNAEHRFCVMHLYRNMYKDHKGIGLRALLWLAARSTTEFMFNQHMTELKKMSRKCHDWLMEKPTTQWSRKAFRTTCQSDMFVNNHCEVFNNSIREYRDLPIIGLLQGLHKSVMKRIQTRRDKMARSYSLNPICPAAMKKVHKAMNQTKGCNVQWSGGSKFLVSMTSGGHEMVVDLDAKTCACKKYDLTGLPCYHACACLQWKNLQVSNYINHSYSKDMYLSCYQHTVEPINSEQYWDKTGIAPPLPPLLKVQPGRPKKKRSTKNDVPVDQTKLRRQSTKMSCSYCKEQTHNARTCPAKKNDHAKNPTKAAPKMKKTSGKGQQKRKPNQEKKGAEKNTNEEVNPMDAITLPNVAGNSQGGIFTSYSQPARLSNAPLGIQPQRFIKHGTQGSLVTTLKIIQAEANARKDQLAKKPQWRL